jgi:hypothetical protein
MNDLGFRDKGIAIDQLDMRLTSFLKITGCFKFIRLNIITLQKII